MGQRHELHKSITPPSTDIPTILGSITGRTAYAADEVLPIPLPTNLLGANWGVVTRTGRRHYPSYKTAIQIVETCIISTPKLQ